MPVNKLTIQEFAERIKEKKPDYKNIDDSTLVSAYLEKYPQYKEIIKIETPKVAEPKVSLGNQRSDTVSQGLMSGNLVTDFNTGMQPQEQPERIQQNQNIASDNTRVNNLKETQERLKGREERQKKIDTAIDNTIVERNRKMKLPDDYDVEGQTKIIKQNLDNGDLVVQPDKNGNPTLKRSSGGFFESFGEALESANQKHDEDYLLTHSSKEDNIFYLNHPEMSLVKEKETAPSGVRGALGEFLGENASGIAKGVIGGIAGGLLAPETGGASVGTFLNTVGEMAQGGYANTLKKTYYALKQQNPNMSDDEAYDKAHNAALIGEAANITSGAVMSKVANKLPEPTVPITGVLNGLKESAKHAVKSFPKVGGSMVGAQVASDIGEMSQGVEKDLHEIVSNATDAAKGAAVMHFGLIAALEPAKIPSYIRPQIENVLASAPREQVAEIYRKAEEAGQIPQGATDKVLNTLSEFDKHKALVEKMPISEEKKAAMTGKLIQRQKLVDENAELSKHGDAFTDRIAENETKIKDLENEINAIPKAKTPFEYERDNITGEKAAGEPEQISKPVELTPEITNEGLTEQETVRIKELTDKQNPKIENGKVVKAGESLTDAEQKELEDLTNKRQDFEGFKTDETTGLKYQDYAEPQKGVDEQTGISFEEEPKLITSKTKENAVQEQSAGEVLQRQQSETGSAGSERERVEPSKQGNEVAAEGKSEKPKQFRTQKEIAKDAHDLPFEFSDEDISRLTHADNDKLYKDLGLDERIIREVKSDNTLREEANAIIRKNKGDMNKVAAKVYETERPMTDAESVAMAKVVGALKARSNDIDPRSEEFDTLMNQIEYLARASDISRSRQGAGLRSNQIYVLNENSLADFVMREKEASKTSTLTLKQKQDAVEKFDRTQKATQEYEKRIAELEQKLKEESAKAKITKQKPATKSRKTSEEFKSEREKLVSDIKDKLKKARSGEGGLTAVPIPYAKELFAIAPEVAKLVKSLVEEGIYKFEDVVKNVHATLKEDIKDITEKDVIDLIDGVYNKVKPTKTDTRIKLENLRIQAELINKLEILQNGEEPTTEKKKIARNREIDELRKKIKDFKKENPNHKGQLESLKAKTEKQISDLKAKMEKGNFAPEEKKTPILDRPEVKQKYPELYKEAVKAKDELIKVKRQNEVEWLKQEYNAKSKFEKAWRNALEIVNIPRTLMSSMDFSAPLRQGLLASISNPREAVNAAKFMFKVAFSQKEFDRWFEQTRNEHPIFKDGEKSGLYIADPHDVRLTAKEEMFMNNLAEKIPIIGRLVKGSERAYVGYLNKLRFDVFEKYAELYHEEGKTFENSPELYKALASFINNSTGRGNLGFAETAAPVLNSLLFSPRLIASRLNMINPVYYAKLPKPIRIAALKSMGRFIALGLTTLALAKAAGASVEADPRSSDFGKIKVGNTRWDIWGGFQQYIRFLTQFVGGQTKQPATGKIQELNGKSAFGQTRADVAARMFRSKLAPVPSMAWDLASGRTGVGEKATVLGEIKDHFLPLLGQDIYDAWKDDGIGKAIAVGLPSTFGVGVSTYQPREKKTNTIK